MREFFLEFLLEITGLNHSGKVKDKNIYYLYDENGDKHIKFEIVPKLIILTGKLADENHDAIVKYIRDLNTGRNIIIDTEYKQTLI